MGTLLAYFRYAEQDVTTEPSTAIAAPPPKLQKKNLEPQNLAITLTGGAIHLGKKV